MVPSTFTKFNAARCLPIILASMLFTGCSTQGPDQTAPFMQGSSQAGSEFYLTQMQQASDNSKTNWQLLAVHALLRESKTPQAVLLYQQLPLKLNETQRREQTLLGAEIKLAQPDYPGAMVLLNTLTPQDLNTPQQARYWKAQIIASEERPSLSLLRALVAEEPLLQDANKQKNIDTTWQILTAMSPAQARTLVINADENTLRGWLDLQQIWFDNRTNMQHLKSAVRDWQTRYPGNPGAKQLPTPLRNMQNLTPASTTTIALLLPLNGQAGIFGRAIQRGFEAAKNNGIRPAVPVAAETQASTPDADRHTANPTPVDNAEAVSPSQANVDDLTEEETTLAPSASTSSQAAQSVSSVPANPSAALKIYDTSAQPISQIVTQVQQDGASIVIGPLLKSDVNELLKETIPINVLALNLPDAPENRINVCYFALSPEDEARDAANHIWQQGRRNPLLLLPHSALASRVANAFTHEWTRLGGGVVLEQAFGSNADLKIRINSGAGIALTGTPVAESQSPQGVSVAGITLPAPTEPQTTAGSGNIDAVYIVASHSEVALIKPMITMRTGSRSGVSLYASSRSARGITGTDYRFEMECLEYSDIPMLAGENPALMQQALATVGNDYSLARLYAMGVDAWSLANHFKQLSQLPGFQLSGNTGQLTATQDCVINRTLTWLKYQQGQVIPVS